MGSDEPLEGRCGAQRRGGDGYCERYPAKGEDGEPINGRCRFHGGSEDIGAGEKNTHAWRHGATASRETLTENLDEEDLAWIADLADRYRQLAGFEEDDPRCDLIMDACLASWQRWSARSEAIANDLTTEAVVDTDENGRPVVKVEEHYLGKMADRLSREIRNTLSSMDILTDDVGGTVDASSAAEIIAAAVEQRDGETDE